MISSKERAAKRSNAQKMNSVTQVGKQGVCDALIESLEKAITKRGIIKVNVLESSGLDPDKAGQEIAERLGAEKICTTGRKVVLFRERPEKKD